MPDETVSAGAVTEMPPETTPELERAFNEEDAPAGAAAGAAAGEAGAAPDKKSAAGKPGADGATGGEGSENADDTKKEPELGPDGKPVPAKTPAQEAAAARAKEIEAAEKQRLIDEEAERIRKSRQAETAPASKPLHERVPEIQTAVLTSLKDLQVEDPESDAEKPPLIGMGELAKKYPGLIKAMVATSQAIAEQLVAPIKAQIETAHANELREGLIASLEDGDEGTKRAPIPNVREIVDSKEFLDWADKQSPAMQSLIDSMDPRDVALGIAAYMEAAGIKPATAAEVQQITDRQKEEKARTDRLHRDTSRTNRVAVSTKPTGAAAEDEAWKEAEKEAEEERKRGERGATGA